MHRAYPLYILILCLFTGTAYAAEQIESTSMHKHSVPKLDSFQLDADASEWSNKGLVVNTFSFDTMNSFSPKDVAYTAQIAWNQDGLLLCLQLHSDHPWVEHANERQGYQKDSIELFMRSGSAWRHLVQAVICPGFDANFKQHRSCMWDYRRDEQYADIETSVVVASKKSNQGGVVEVLLPWNQLRLEAKAGLEIEFRININKVIPGYGRQQSIWRRNDGNEFQQLVLTDAAKQQTAPSQQAWIIDSDPQQIGIAIDADQTSIGASYAVHYDDQNILSGILTASERGSQTRCWIPHNLINDHKKPLSIRLNGKEISRKSIADPAPALRLQLERAFLRRYYRGNSDLIKRLTPRIPHLLSNGQDLPPAVMPDSDLINVIGVESLKTIWYNNEHEVVTTATANGRYAAVSTITLNNGQSFTTYQTAVLVDEAVLKNIGNNLGIDKHAFNALKQAVSSAFSDNLTLLTQTAVTLHEKSSYPEQSQHMWLHQLRSKIGTQIVYPYNKRLPTDYETDTNKKWPAIIYLHGSNGKLPSQQISKETRVAEVINRDLLGWSVGKNKPFAMYALISDGGWESDAVLDTVDKILAEDRIDPDRIILMGFSMGGMGTWRCLVEHPERWAAAMPIGGRGDYAAYMDRVTHVPVWAFNGDADFTTTLAAAQVGVDALKKAGGDVRLTVFPGVGHGGSQNQCFETPGVWEWMAERKRSKQ